MTTSPDREFLVKANRIWLASPVSDVFADEPAFSNQTMEISTK